MYINIVRTRCVFPLLVYMWKSKQSPLTLFCRNFLQYALYPQNNEDLTCDSLQNIISNSLYSQQLLWICSVVLSKHHTCYYLRDVNPIAFFLYKLTNWILDRTCGESSLDWKCYIAICEMILRCFTTYMFTTELQSLFSRHYIYSTLGHV